MTTFVGSAEAARLLGVAPATLYAYVSRGRITRRAAADGRTSLFALADVEALADRSRRGPLEPRPTIDVRISSSITSLREDGVTVRGHELAHLANNHSFEAIAELLWTGSLGATSPAWPPCRDRPSLAGITTGDPVARLMVAASLLGDAHPDDDAASAARRLIVAAPIVLGTHRSTGSMAQRIAGTWSRRPAQALVEAIDTALGLLADHELATSTLAVRLAASVRSTPMAAFIAGLAVVSGRLHGSASIEAHGFLAECAAGGVASTVAAYRADRRRIPGFGHKVYRGPDPRFNVLLDSVRRVGDVTLVDDVLAEVGRVVPQHPNIDLSLGALSFVAGIDDATPLFAIARIAGWAAHYTEELAAPPVRFRGITA